MEIIWNYIYFYIILNIVNICNGFPINNLSTLGWNEQSIILLAVAVTICAISLFIGCVCCQRRLGFKEFRDSSVSASALSDVGDPGHVNPIASSEFTIFTPLSPPHHNNNVFRSSQPRQPIHTGSDQVQIEGVDHSSWFVDGSRLEFSRNKLKYIRELGSGWFGRVVEGEAESILEENVWTPVAVRILETTASAHEQAIFLNEASIYKLEPHPNILKLQGHSLESAPLLLIQEFCSRGDLKKFLLENASSANSSVGVNLPLKFSCQLASALQYLHENNIPHLDLATRTCQLKLDLSLKLGDYGTAVNQYPQDYYQGVPAIPVRWCAPETINYTNTTLQPKPTTKESNIWSLGVTLWEICEWGTQPYNWLTDDEVISHVLGPRSVRLGRPEKTNGFYIDHMYKLMRLCWDSEGNRPNIQQVYNMLVHLLQVSNNNTPSKSLDFSSEDFDSRWESFKPNTIVKTDNQIDTDYLTVEKSTGISSISSNEYQNDEKKSPSMTNLHGSFENLTNEKSLKIKRLSNENLGSLTIEKLPKKVTKSKNKSVLSENLDKPQNPELDSWLQNVAMDTKDMSYVRNLSEVIHDLDSALASEPTSSSSINYPENQNRKLDFKIGEPIGQEQIFGRTLDESESIMNSICYPKNESGSETEDETWKKRIERGAYSEKVRQKSKSVTDLMVLTHIDPSESDSETPLPSLDYKPNFPYKNVRFSGGMDNSLIYGSEGNLLEIQDTFQEELKKLQEERKDSLLFVPVGTSFEEESKNDLPNDPRNLTETHFSSMKNEEREKQGPSIDQKTTKHVVSPIKIEDPFSRALPKTISSAKTEEIEHLGSSIDQNKQEPIKIEPKLEDLSVKPLQKPISTTKQEQIEESSSSFVQNKQNQLRKSQPKIEEPSSKKRQSDSLPLRSEIEASSLEKVTKKVVTFLESERNVAEKDSFNPKFEEDLKTQQASGSKVEDGPSKSPILAFESNFEDIVAKNEAFGKDPFEIAVLKNQNPIEAQNPNFATGDSASQSPKLSFESNFDDEVTKTEDPFGTINRAFGSNFEDQAAKFEDNFGEIPKTQSPIEAWNPYFEETLEEPSQIEKGLILTDSSSPIEATNLHFGEAISPLASVESGLKVLEESSAGKEETKKLSEETQMQIVTKIEETLLQSEEPDQNTAEEDQIVAVHRPEIEETPHVEEKYSNSVEDSAKNVLSFLENERKVSSDDQVSIDERSRAFDLQYHENTNTFVLNKINIPQITLDLIPDDNLDKVSICSDEGLVDIEDIKISLKEEILPACEELQNFEEISLDKSEASSVCSKLEKNSSEESDQFGLKIEEIEVQNADFDYKVEKSDVRINVSHFDSEDRPHYQASFSFDEDLKFNLAKIEDPLPQNEELIPQSEEPKPEIEGPISKIEDSMSKVDQVPQYEEPKSKIEDPIPQNKDPMSKSEATAQNVADFLDNERRFAMSDPILAIHRPKVEETLQKIEDPISKNEKAMPQNEDPMSQSIDTIKKIADFLDNERRFAESDPILAIHRPKVEELLQKIEEPTLKTEGRISKSEEPIPKSKNPNPQSVDTTQKVADFLENERKFAETDPILAIHRPKVEEMLHKMEETPPISSETLPVDAPTPKTESIPQKEDVLLQLDDQSSSVEEISSIKQSVFLENAKVSQFSSSLDQFEDEKWPEKDHKTQIEELSSKVEYPVPKTIFKSNENVPIIEEIPSKVENIFESKEDVSNLHLIEQKSSSKLEENVETKTLSSKVEEVPPKTEEQQPEMDHSQPKVEDIFDSKEDTSNLRLPKQISSEEIEETMSQMKAFEDKYSDVPTSSALEFIKVDSSIISTVKDFINAEKLNSEGLVDTKMKKRPSNLSSVTQSHSFIDYNTLQDPKNVKPQIYNVFNVTIDHGTPDFLSFKDPILSPKNGSVCTSSLQKDLPDLIQNKPLLNGFIPQNEKPVFTSTPFHKRTKKSQIDDSESSVILGPCEDYTLGLYSGLKTTFDKYSDVSEEELLQFSSNFMPLETTIPEKLDFSLESWEKCLEKTLVDNQKTYDNFPRLESLKLDDSFYVGVSQTDKNEKNGANSKNFDTKTLVMTQKGSEPKHSGTKTENEVYPSEETRPKRRYFDLTYDANGSIVTKPDETRRRRRFFDEIPSAETSKTQETSNTEEEYQKNEKIGFDNDVSSKTEQVSGKTELVCGKTEQFSGKNDQTFVKGEETYIKGNQTYLANDKTFVKNDISSKNEETFTKNDEILSKNDQTYLKMDKSCLYTDETCHKNGENSPKIDETFCLNDEAPLKTKGAHPDLIFVQEKNVLDETEQAKILKMNVLNTTLEHSQESSNKLQGDLIFDENFDKGFEKIVETKRGSIFDETFEKGDGEPVLNSWEPGEGWFLHPQTLVEGEMEVQDNSQSYIGFALDEECVNALRNELAAKLPNAMGQNQKEFDEFEDEISDPSEERDEIIVKYNVYATPLSPIPEESCCDDMFCDQTQHNDGSDSDTDSNLDELDDHSKLESPLVIDTETHMALILGSASPKELGEALKVHTPSQDSCCSNDTLFNVEDINFLTSDPEIQTLQIAPGLHEDLDILKTTPEEPKDNKKNDADTSEKDLTLQGDFELNKNQEAPEGTQVESKGPQKDSQEPQEPTEPQEIPKEPIEEPSEEEYVPLKNLTLIKAKVDLEKMKPDSVKEPKTSKEPKSCKEAEALKEPVPKELEGLPEDANQVQENQNQSQTTLTPDILEGTVKMSSKPDEEEPSKLPELKKLTEEPNLVSTGPKIGTEIPKPSEGIQKLLQFENFETRTHEATSGMDRKGSTTVPFKPTEVVEGSNLDLNDPKKKGDNQNGVEGTQKVPRPENLEIRIHEASSKDPNKSLLEPNEAFESLESRLSPNLDILETSPDDETNTTTSNSTTTDTKSTLKLNLVPLPQNVAHLPSPEEIPWKQLPASLLSYSQVALETPDSDTEQKTDTEDFDEEDQEDFFELEDTYNDFSNEDNDNLYLNLMDIRFSGPCDNQIMSTSFSESNNDLENDKDWDSGSDTRSSSSGEFIWKEGEHEESVRVLNHDQERQEAVSSPMEVIAEENSETSEDDDDEDEIEETEFVPSAWDSQATPTKSALRSPEKSSNKNKSIEKKGVSFKKEKYHCVYEYPREAESPITQTADLWRPLADFSNYAELWDLDPQTCLQMDDDKDVYESRRFPPRDYYQMSTGSPKLRDFYQVNSYPDFTTGRDLFAENITPDSGIDDITPGSLSESTSLDFQKLKNEIPSLKTLASLAANKTVQKDVLGGLRHTRNRLKLDLPPSPSSLTTHKTFNMEYNTDPLNRETPTFTTFGKSRFSVQHVETPTEDPLATAPCKNVSFEALPYKPQGPKNITSNPENLTELQLTKTVVTFLTSDLKETTESEVITSPMDDLNLDKFKGPLKSDSLNSEDPLSIDPKLEELDSSKCNKPVEVVRGEASLLDSADEDSGIESSTNATLERQISN